MSDPLPPITPAPTPTPNSNRPPESSGLAIASLVLGILSLVCFGLLSGIPAIICGKIGRTKIRNSAGTLTGSGLATAGIITGAIGTALSIIGIALFFALPAVTASMAFQRMEKQKITCIQNLKAIDGAKQQWALETKASTDATPTWENLTPYLGRGTVASLPVCPSGGTYTLGSVNTAPRCDVRGHTIEE
jgi:hypothetical protein